MSNPSKSKGTAAESNVRQYLKARGWKHARRLTLGGALDPGDISLGDGVDVTIEVKDCARIELAKWLDETRAEMRNNGHDIGAAWFKRRGTTDPARWYVLMDGEAFTLLLQQAHHTPLTRVQ